MFAYIKLELTDVDSFCSNMNLFKSNIIAIEEDKSIYIKSLISFLTVDLSKEICIKIESSDEKELKHFTEIIERYGGKIVD